jgi:hypothetical protein
VFLNKSCRKFHVHKYSSHTFPIQNGLKQGDAFLPLLLNFAFVYANKKVQAIHVGLKLIRCLELLTFADDVNLKGGNVNTMRKKKEL